MRDRTEEELKAIMPVVAKLIDRYTSKESSSVSYDTAGLLMEAALYCIEMAEDAHGNEYALVNDSESRPDYMALYSEGKQMVIEMAKESVALYNKLMENYDDYGVRLYADTVLKALPNFFKKYDVDFRPGAQINLSYPIQGDNVELTGIKRVHQYIRLLLREQKALSMYNRDFVIQELESASDDYRNLFADNILELVLR